jgi:hypothetical protein
VIAGFYRLPARQKKVSKRYAKRTPGGIIHFKGDGANIVFQDYQWSSMSRKMPDPTEVVWDSLMR